MARRLIEEYTATGLFLNQQVFPVFFDYRCNRDVRFPGHDPVLSTF
jgi:hypothetical protein